MAAVLEKKLKLNSPDALLLAALVNREKQIRHITETAEIVIVGGGIAGAYLACCLGEAGVSAVVLEQSSKISYDGQTAISLKTLKSFPLLRGVQKRADSNLDIVSPKGQILSPSQEEKKISFFSRSELETFLVEEAIARGAVFHRERVLSALPDRGTWTVQTENRTVSCRFVVGADGWNSMIRSVVSSPISKEDLLFGAGCLAKTSQGTGLQIRFLDDGEYVRTVKWGDSASFGVFGSALKAKDIRYTLDNLVRLSLGTIRPVSPWAAFIPCPSSEQFYSQPCSGRNWILIGDAAGHVHPLSGEGIHYALWSAELASQALLCGEPRLFDTLWHDSYGYELQTAVKIRNSMMKHGKSAEWLFSVASRSHTIERFLTDISLAGMLENRMAFRVIKELPLSILELVGANLKGWLKGDNRA